MTPRVEAWFRQADNDLAMADDAVVGGFHAQACCHGQATEKALKAILISRYPDGDQAPSELSTGWMPKAVPAFVHLLMP